LKRTYFWNLKLTIYSNRHRRIHEQQQNGESVENFSEEDLEGEADLSQLGALEEEGESSEQEQQQHVYLNGMHAAHMAHHMPTTGGGLGEGLVAVSNGSSSALSMNMGTPMGENGSIGGHHHGHGHLNHHHVLSAGGMGPPMMVGQNY
jgi:hypothetical protein